MQKGGFAAVRSSGLPGSGSQDAATGVFFEFFAGGGMARAGLGPRWRCAFANEIDQKKAAVYAANWGAVELRVGDVAELISVDLPGAADLAWASFPCQDLSLAGAGAGLTGRRSGTFWPFWKLMEALAVEGRAPAMVALENVCGALTSHQGRDFARIGAAFAEAGYQFGALVIDAARFLPQSRPRLFLLGVRDDLPVPPGLSAAAPDPRWHPPALVTAFERLGAPAASRWRWWSMPGPTGARPAFADIIEEHPPDVDWHSAAETTRLISLMNPVNLSKVRMAQKTPRCVVGTVYKRTRTDEAGTKVQRAEVRFDNMAGCLRTPAGGSSRQSIIVIEGDRIRSRLLSSREAARLMGLPDEYRLPHNYNEAYHLAGDGVAVPVVRYLSAHLIEPLIASGSKAANLAA
jgi:DNA (cytosine-5)-methyltransferase 1